MILKLTNSKGRICFQATRDGQGIDIKHESGGGWANKPEDVFLSAACTWNDNPSCKVEGEYKDQFLQYCIALEWLKVNAL
jgi:hypothetical protein